MIRVSSSKWMLLALLSVMLTTNSADTTLEAELGHPDVQFSENSMEGVRLARAAPKTTNSNNAKGGVKSNGGTAGSGGTAVSGGTGGNKTAAGNGNAGVTGGAGGATVPTQPSKAAANSGVEPSTTMTPPDTNPTITTIATQPETTKTTTETTPTTLKTTEGTTPTTKVPEVLKSTFLRQQCQVHSPFDGCVDKLLDCLSENPPCNSTVANAAKKAAREIDTYKNCPDTECAGKQIKTLTTALEEEENARCQNGYKNSCKKEWEKTLKDLTACPKGSPDLRCMPKKTVPTPTPPTPEAPNSTVIYDFCKKDPKGFDACVNKLLECQKVTPLCDFNIAEASKKAARSIYDYKKCSDLKCAKGQETALKNALNEEENVRCKGDPSCTLEAQNTIAQLTDCSLDPTASRCIPKSLDIFESCPNDNTYAGCVNKQLDCQNTCQPGLAEDAREAAYKIVSYLQCEDSVCAKDKETELEEALKKEATSRCKGNPSCVPEWQDTLKIVTDCSSDPNVSRCKPPTTTTTTPALPAQVEAPKAKDIYEFCKKALQPFDTCVSDQLSICQSGTSSCDSNVVTAVKNAVNVIYEYDKSPDSKSADEKKDKLRKALEYEADVRCKGDPSCISSTEVQKTFDEVTACPDPLLPRCVPTVTTLLPNNNPSSTSSSPVTNSTQLASNTTTSSIASQTPAVPVFPPGGSAQTSTSPSTDEQDPGTEEYVPPHEDLPEDFSCQNLGEKYKACEYLCKQLASLKPYEDPGIDWRFLPGAFMTAGSLLAIPILFVLTKRMTNELAALNQQTPTAADDPNAKLKIAYAAALDVKDPKNPEKKEEKSQEVPSPPSLKNNPAAQKMRAKLLETQQNLQKLRTHAKKCVEEHKKDAASSKFQKKGAIYIPNEPEIPPPAPLPDNIILDNVEWCSDYNEMYVIGSDVDDIELDQDYVMNPDSFTTDDDEDKSKKSQKSKNSKKSKKSAKSKKSKKDVPSTSGAPSAAPPASTTSAPSTSTPSVDAKRESNQNKSKEQQ